jgi:hypothetical protein
MQQRLDSCRAVTAMRLADMCCFLAWPAFITAYVLICLQEVCLGQ